VQKQKLGKQEGGRHITSLYRPPTLDKSVYITLFADAISLFISCSAKLYASICECSAIDKYSVLLVKLSRQRILGITERGVQRRWVDIT